MDEPERTRIGSRQGITGLAAWITTAALAASAGAGCATKPGAPPAADAEAAATRLRAAAPPAAAVVVRLAFGSEADFDLYVTGPRQETVYFANTPTKIGGRLDADRRCAAPAPRIETVVFPDPRPGHYRVGVDFPEACDGGREPASFALDVRSAAGHVERTGWLAPGEFEPIVFEWEEPPLAPAGD